ncbi:MAG TPA: TrkA C-terminal domain-containing protein, partial [Burkholderiaceae bacterium]|nr:TrkA C-terminal domain-containing protein [Burkholderiaceae bacterium]
DTAAELQQARLTSVTLPMAATCLGKPLSAQALHAIGVQVVSIRVASGRVLVPDEDQVLAAGDTLVLSGLPQALALAEEKLLRV